MGKIVRISGPVVIAEDVENAKMFDVVRVGELGLVGEIIRIVGDKATIQVYEDTSGIRPGEKVENTSRPLSVDLGPGLLKSIYDGIQRPLDVIRAKSGDFIQRGFTASPLDEEKLWEFTPTVSKGTEVVEGQILGKVQETGIIEHRVMVPYGTSGKLLEIKQGKFKVSDTVAVIEGRAGKINVRLKQEWPVRVPRKVQRKLPPEVPMITGQRVIDTFFPVAKGGTVAVPGPFGSGKCVTGDTPVLLGNGNVVEIKNLFDEAIGTSDYEGRPVEEYVILPEPIRAFSYSNGRIEGSSSGILYRGKSDSIISIKTRSGRNVRVTPVHKLFQVRENGLLLETPAGELHAGDLVASVNRYHGDFTDSSIMSEQESEQFAIANPETRIPQKVDSNFAEFIGMIMASGRRCDNGLITFSNSDEILVRRISDLALKLFGLKCNPESQGECGFSVSIENRPIADFITGICRLDSLENAMVPTSIMKSSNSSVSAFLAGFYLAREKFSSVETEFILQSKQMQIQFSYLLARFGIQHNFEESKTNGTSNHRVSVTGTHNIGLLGKVLSGEQPPLDFHTQYMNTEETPQAPEYLSGRNEAVLEASRHDSRQISEWLYQDEIVSIMEEQGPFDVYDISVPEHGSNFIGGFGGILLHNTVVQHQLSKWADSDIVVYVGCGERGNEMTEILTTFPELQDPRSGKPLMERTVLIANTSNMPVAAREASIYTGITIAEYYRDMGYNVALMADSTSRWAEALREISGRLEEMPGEEGYPAYLGRRLSEFYERSGNAIVKSNEGRNGSITIVGAVSPPGGDISEPVSQNTLRVTRVFWALDSSLASRRHFPSINWLNSYSLYQGDLMNWFNENVTKEWAAIYEEAMGILQKEAELQEVVQLVGYDALPEREKNTLDIARMIREDFLQQSAFDEVDQYCSIGKQYRMLNAILTLGKVQSGALDKGLQMAQIQGMKVRAKISRMKEVKEQDFQKYYDEVMAEMKEQVGNILEVS